MLLPALILLPMAMAPLARIAGKRSRPARTLMVSLTCLAEFFGALLVWRTQPSFAFENFCGLGLHLRADGFRGLYGAIAAFMWLMSDLFCPEYFAHHHNRGRYLFFNLLTLGATLGVLWSDDLGSTLVFFEIMSLASTPWVAQEETPGALRATDTYLAVAIIGGLTTLMGLFMLWHRLGTLSFEGMGDAVRAQGGADAYLTTAAWLTLFGFAAKAGLFPLHIWLPKAHPVAPAPASALLSGILTKTGVFGLIVVGTRLFQGQAASAKVLLALGAVTMFLGALLALFSVDLKRTLACSSASQIGFITLGLSLSLLLGEEGSLAAYGTLEHMLNHSLIKLCLFLCAGVVYMNLHKLNLNDIRGFGRNKPLLHACFLAGALSIGCIPPLGSGYNSKSLLHEGLLEYIHHLQVHGGPWQAYKALEILFLISGGLTIAYMTKLYICLFHEKHPRVQDGYDGMRSSYMSWPTAIVLALTGVGLPFLGLLGEPLLSPLAASAMPFFGQEPLGHPIAYFSWENLKGAAESIAIGAAVYLVVVRRGLMAPDEHGVRVYVNRWPSWLDLEEKVYRPFLNGLAAVLGAVFGWLAALPDARWLRRAAAGIGRATEWIAALPDAPWLRRLADGFGRMTDWVAALPDAAWLHRGAEGAGTVLARGMAEFPERLVLGVRALFLRPLRPHAEHTHSHPQLDTLTEEGERISHSSSYGLLLLALGLLAVLVFLIAR